MVFKMKVKKRLSKLSFIIVTIALLYSNVVYASGDVVNKGKEFLNKGSQQQTSVNFQNATSGFSDLAGILWGIGIILIVIAGGVIGIRYMMSSVEEKAEHKKLLIPYLVGSVIIFGALTIWRLLINLFNGTVI